LGGIPALTPAHLASLKKRIKYGRLRTGIKHGLKLGLEAADLKLNATFSVRDRKIKRNVLNLRRQTKGLQKNALLMESLLE